MAIDVDYITAKRAEADRLDVDDRAARKIRDDLGNRMVDLLLEIEAAFPDGEGGDAAREVLARRRRPSSRDRLCTVSRTVTVGSPWRPRVCGTAAGWVVGSDPTSCGSSAYASSGSSSSTRP